MEDLLNRDEFIRVVEKMIYSTIKNNDKVSIAIDGVWGSGKSWVINKLLEDLKLNNTNPKAKDYKCFPIIYNCWEKDYYEEPLLGILNSIISIKKSFDLSSELTVVFDELTYLLEEIFYGLGIVFGKVPSVVSKGLGITRHFTSKLRNKYSFNNMNLDDKLDKVVNCLKKICNKLPIVFIVDEIDRTLPEYAIKVLERLHHIFNNVSKCITIVATDKHQLDKSIKDIYGIDDDSRVDLYFKKFFDFRLKLDVGDFNNIKYDEFKNKAYEEMGLEMDSYHGRTNVIKEFLSDIDIRSKLRILERTNQVYPLLVVYENNSQIKNFLYVGILAYISYIECINNNEKLSSLLEYVDRVKTNFYYPNQKEPPLEFHLDDSIKASIIFVFMVYLNLKDDDEKYQLKSSRPDLDYYVTNIINRLSEMYKYME